MRTFIEIQAAVKAGKSFTDLKLTSEEEKGFWAGMSSLNVTVGSNGTMVARVAKPGEMLVPYKGKDKEGKEVDREFRVYIGEKGQIHFQGIPGANKQFGMSLYATTLECLYNAEDKLMEFIASNKEKLSWVKPPTTPKQ